MSDAALRELARVVTSAPDDGPARLLLARGLVRAGRRDEALAALDLSRLDDALVDEARPLCAELWREALGRLARAWAIDLAGAVSVGEGAVRLDGASRSLLVVGDWRAATVTLVDAAAGEVLHVEPEVRALRAFAARDGFVVQDEGTRRLIGLRRGTDRVERVVTGSAPDVQLVDVDPDGGRVLLWSAGRASLHRWPDLRLVASWAGYGPVVDWAGGHLVLPTSGGGLDVHPLGGGAPWTIDLPVPWVVTRVVVAPGVLACGGNGLRLVHLRRRWTLGLVRAQRRGPLHAPSVASDRRGVRFVLGQRAVRVDVDLARGVVLAAPPDLERLGRHPAAPAQIHPHADAWVPWVRPGGHALRAFDGARLASLPADAGEPRAWSPDGRALALVRGAGDTSRLAVWRVS